MRICGGEFPPTNGALPQEVSALIFILSFVVHTGDAFVHLTDNVGLQIVTPKNVLIIFEWSPVLIFDVSCDVVVVQSSSTASITIITIIIRIVITEYICKYIILVNQQCSRFRSGLAVVSNWQLW